ncbi:MAG: polysaccharide biosynthesis tyrosine autokinase [Planctomycetes bacterium]|nr:polysaccharide biosynthesis tyrosine autokinase [Planctomycetota bacterium]
MELKDYLRVLVRRWPWMVASAVLVGAILWSMSLWKSVPYFATIDIHYKKTPLELGYFQPEDYTYPFTSNQARSELFFHQDVLRRASKSLSAEGLTCSPSDLQTWVKLQGSSIENTVALRAEHADADVPLRLLRAMYRAYIQHLKAEYMDAFDKAIARVDMSLEESQKERKRLQESLRTELERLNAQTNVFDPEVQSQIMSSLIVEMEKSRQQNRLDLVRVERRLREVPEGERRLAEDEVLREHLLPLGAPDADASPTRRARRLELKMIELRKKYYENHPAMQTLQEEWNELQAAMAEELEKAAVARAATLVDQKRMLEAAIGLIEGILKEEYSKLKSLRILRLELASAEKKVMDCEDRYIKLRDRRTSLEEAKDKTDSMTDLSVVVIRETPQALPVPATKRISLPITLFLAVIVGLAVGYLVDYLADALRTPHDVKVHLNLPTIATIPFAKGEPLNLLQSAEGSSMYEAYNKLAIFLDSMAQEKRAGSVLFVSTKAREGKTTVSANVAIALARSGRRVTLVDGDIRRPHLHTWFGVDNSRGLSTILSAGYRSEEELRAALSGDGLAAFTGASPTENLSVLTAGPQASNPLFLLRSAAMDWLLKHLRTQTDLVLMDSPPLIGLIDGAVLASRADLTVVVVAENEVRRSEAAQMKHALAQVNANLVGAVINKSRSRPESYYYYYYYRPTAAP